MVPFPAEDGGGEKFGAVEDVVDEDLAEMGRSMLRPYKGMERGRRVRMQGSGGKKAAGRFGGRGDRERIESGYFSRLAVNCTSDPDCTVISFDQSL